MLEWSLEETNHTEHFRRHSAHLHIVQKQLIIHMLEKLVTNVVTFTLPCLDRKTQHEKNEKTGQGVLFDKRHLAQSSYAA